MGARSVQGMADAFVITTCYSVVAIEFPAHLTTYLGYMDMSYGLGWMLGPWLGFLFMRLTNSVLFTFLLFGLLQLIGMIAAFLTLPTSLNKPNAGMENLNSKSTEVKKDTNVWLFLKERRSLVCILGLIMSMVTLSSFDPTLSIWLKQAYGISEKDNGIVFGLVPLFFSITSSLMGFVTARIQRRVTIFFGFLLGSLGLLFIAPSSALLLP